MTDTQLPADVIGPMAGLGGTNKPLEACHSCQRATIYGTLAHLASAGASVIEGDLADAAGQPGAKKVCDIKLVPPTTKLLSGKAVVIAKAKSTCDMAPVSHKTQVWMEKELNGEWSLYAPKGDAKGSARRSRRPARGSPAPTSSGTARPASGGPRRW